MKPNDSCIDPGKAKNKNNDAFNCKVSITARLLEKYRPSKCLRLVSSKQKGMINKRAA